MTIFVFLSPTVYRLVVVATATDARPSFELPFVYGCLIHILKSVAWGLPTLGQVGKVAARFPSARSGSWVLEFLLLSLLASATFFLLFSRVLSRSGALVGLAVSRMALIRPTSLYGSRLYRWYMVLYISGVITQVIASLRGSPVAPTRRYCGFWVVCGRLPETRPAALLR